MEKNFVALDVETAVGKRYSICQIGIVVVENNKVVEKVSRLVQPPNNEYFYYNTKVHGITANDTRNEPFFPEVWSELYPKLKGKKLVAHNAKFDKSCLKQALSYYEMDVPEFDFDCTLELTGLALDLATKKYKVQLVNHHDALADALACAELYMKV